MYPLFFFYSDLKSIQSFKNTLPATVDDTPAAVSQASCNTGPAELVAGRLKATSIVNKCELVVTLNRNWTN